MPYLKWLHVAYVDDVDLSYLAGLNNLEDLAVIGENIRNPEGLSNLTHLESLSLYEIVLAQCMVTRQECPLLGRQLYLEKYGSKQIHVVDSESASCGEAQIALKLLELEEKGLPFEDIVE